MKSISWCDTTCSQQNVTRSSQSSPRISSSESSTTCCTREEECKKINEIYEQIILFFANVCVRHGSCMSGITYVHESDPNFEKMRRIRSYVTWPTHVWREAFTCHGTHVPVTWLIRMWRHDSSIRDMTHLYMKWTARHIYMLWGGYD